MKQEKVWMEAKARNFTKTDNGVKWEAVIFSSEFNRNKAYFDIKKMFKPFQTRTDLLNKVLLNNSHNGKYFSVATDKVIEVVIEESEDGQLIDVYAVIESTNEEKKSRPELVTGFSIELLVDEQDVAVFPDKSEFYRKPEWIGLAYLEGQLAGSGDTRILSVKTFAETQTNTMQFKLFSQLAEGDIVTDKASNQPAFIVTLSIEEGETTVELELFDGGTAVYAVPNNSSEESMPIAYLGTSGAIKAIVAMLKPTEPEPEPEPEAFSKDADIDQNLEVFKELEKEDRENKMKIFKQLKNNEVLAEGNQKTASETVGLSLRERVISNLKNIQI